MQMNFLSNLAGTNNRINKIFGWIAVGISTAIAALWSFWGIVENFHEGWFHESLIQNISLMFIQYLSIPIIFIILTMIAIKWRRIGGALCFLAAIGLGIFLWGAHISVMALIVLPLVILGLLFWFGSPEPKKYAYLIAVIIPVMVILGFGIPNGVKISQRINDSNLNARMVTGNDVELIWAPDGPGWPGHGISWDEANNICRYLSADGMVIENTPQNIWRLPTVDEAVRSMSRHGINASGIWNPDTEKASYEIEPDKETPLWNPNSQIIYYWTATGLDEDTAYMIVYDGKVYPRNKSGSGSLAFRAVKNPGDY
jgi:hypothetical protein